MALESASAAAIVLGRMPAASSSGDFGARFAEPCADALERAIQGLVLLAGGVDERHELVHLEETFAVGLGALMRMRLPRAGLRSMCSSSMASSRMLPSVSMSFRIDASPSGSDPPPAPVAQLRARGDGAPQLLGLAQLVSP